MDSKVKSKQVLNIYVIHCLQYVDLIVYNKILGVEIYYSDS